jgi:hypothetical protein
VKLRFISTPFKIFNQILTIQKQFYLCPALVIVLLNQKLQLWRTKTTKKEWKAFIANASGRGREGLISLM